MFNSKSHQPPYEGEPLDDAVQRNSASNRKPKILLYDPHNQATVAAEILPMTRAHYQTASSSWVKSFERRSCTREQDDDSWMWNASASQLDLLLHRTDLSSFALIADTRIDGVLFLQREPQPSRLDPQQFLVYVAYVATAPWNRRDKNGAGKLRGVGTSLIDWAALISREAKCDGCLGLHSLRSSDPFYESLGFRNLGIDAARFGMTYFELVKRSN